MAYDFKNTVDKMYIREDLMGLENYRKELSKLWEMSHEKDSEIKREVVEDMWGYVMEKKKSLLDILRLKWEDL